LPLGWDSFFSDSLCLFPTLFWCCWGWIPGSQECYTRTLTLSHTPNSSNFLKMTFIFLWNSLFSYLLEYCSIEICLVVFSWLDWNYVFWGEKSERWSGFSIIFISRLHSMNITNHCHCWPWLTEIAFGRFLCYKDAFFPSLSKLHSWEVSHCMRFINKECEVIYKMFQACLVCFLP
jgi:hypothetical protein